MKTIQIAMATVAAAATLATAQEARKVGWSTGYYAAWATNGYPVTAIRWKAYTHMCHFSVIPRADGTVNETGMGLNDARFRAFVAEAKKNNVKTLICVGGAGTGGQFQQMSSTVALRAKFIENIILFMQKYGYDGIDMDWEEIGGKETQYHALHRELRVALDKITPRPLLTVAMANYISASCGPVYSVFDQMNNMCYWTKSNPPSNSNLTNDFKRLVDAGIPKSKMGVGIGWDYEENGNPEVDCDPVSTKNKILYAMDQGYGGVMVWAIEKDRKRNGATEPSNDTLSHYVVPNSPVGLIGGGPFSPNRGVTLAVGRDAGGLQVIRYSIPSLGDDLGSLVDLGLYDMDGRHVKTLASGNRAPGEHSVSLTRGGSSSVRPGAYVVSLSAGQERKSSQTVLLP